MIAIFAAMESELRACLPALISPEHLPDGRFPLVRADGVVICQTGLGRVSRDAADAVLGEIEPGAVLSVGTAGGLTPGLGVGDLVLCERVRHSEEPGVVESDTRLFQLALEIARDHGLAARPGTSVTVDMIAWGPEEKAALHALDAPDITEMESYWIGLAAASRRLPYLAIRAISDDATNRLVEIPGLFDGSGHVDSARLLAFTREHPDLIPELAAGHARGGIALASLGRFLQAYLPRLQAAIL